MLYANNYRNQTILRQLNNPGGEKMKPRRIYCKYCNNILVVIHKPGYSIIEVECTRCGELSIVKLFKGAKEDS